MRDYTFRETFFFLNRFLHYPKFLIFILSINEIFVAEEVKQKSTRFFSYINLINFLSALRSFISLYLCFYRHSWISTWSPRLAMPRAKYSTSRWRVTTTGISQKSPPVIPEIVRIDPPRVTSRTWSRGDESRNERLGEIIISRSDAIWLVIQH